MSNPTVWIGGQGVNERPVSPRTDNTLTAAVTTRFFTGPYAALESQMPLFGDAVSGGDGGYVSHATLEHAEGGSGILTVEFTQPIRKPKRRVTWAYEDVDLLTIPRYDAMDEGQLALTRAACEEADLVLLPFESGSLNNHDNDPIYKLALDAFKKWMRGERSARVYYPVVTLTTYSPNPTANSGSALNTIQQPPGIARAPYQCRLTGKPWIYIGTGDSDNDLDDGTTERVQEWQGRVSVDRDLLASNWWNDPDESARRRLARKKARR